MEVVSEVRCGLGEGPVWDDQTGLLYWLDIVGERLHRSDGTVVELGVQAGALALTASGRMLLAVPDGFAWLADLSTAPPQAAQNRQTPAVASKTGVPCGGTPAKPVVSAVTMPNPGRFNDGKCDPEGRFWAGTITEPGQAALYRLDADLTVSTALTEVTISNGLGWSPDGGTFYYIDTPTNRIDAFDYAAGEIGGRRTLVEITQGSPDGMTVDADGCLWVALWGGAAVHRYTPGGALDRTIEMPVAKPSSVTFGGSGLDTLFITSAGGVRDPDNPLAGALFAVDPGVSGLPAHRFGGAP
ncbi:MAG TPA: SMP-30/gluconolactonase/LRE family protein [Actinokineospora sp.]|nr:SMP-30/gluconolactonase/LRE family protein [Actinokineospora sp.]